MRHRGQLRFAWKIGTFEWSRAQYRVSVRFFFGGRWKQGSYWFLCVGVESSTAEVDFGRRWSCMMCEATIYELVVDSRKMVGLQRGYLERW